MHVLFILIINAGTNNFGIPAIRDESNPIIDYDSFYIKIVNRV